MGHVSPQLALIERLSDFPFSTRWWYVGSRSGIETTIVFPDDGKCSFIWAGKLRRYWSLQNIFSPLEFIFGFLQSIWLLLRFRPHLIFSTGGFVSVPLVFAGWLLGIPIVIHEQTRRTGLANRLTSPLAQKILLGFPREEESKRMALTQQERMQVVGNPIRSGLLQGEAERARRKFGFSETLPTILFMGGSQGAHFLNSWLMQHVEVLTERYQVIAVTGKNEDFSKLEQVRYQLLKPQRLVVVPFLQGELADVYALADLVICRSGAGTVSELHALGKKAILIPLPLSAEGEQQANAEWLQQQGMGKVLSQVDLEQHPDRLQELIQQQLVSPEILSEQVDAVNNIFQVWEEVLVNES